jgi:tRNA 2-thiouridine synthesizing protein A
MTKTRATKTLDIKGLNCPKPLLWARSQLDSLNPGETIEVVATDPSTVSNFQAFCRTAGYELVEWGEKDGVIRLLIRKSA